jgi:hypothetical protein
MALDRILLFERKRTFTGVDHFSWVDRLRGTCLRRTDEAVRPDEDCRAGDDGGCGQSVNFRMIAPLFEWASHLERVAGLARKPPNPEGEVGEDGHCDDRHNHDFRHWRLPLCCLAGLQVDVSA